MTATELAKVAAAINNMDRDTLEGAGVIKRGQVGGSDWKRFNDEPMIFVAKLPPEKLAILAELITAEM